MVPSASNESVTVLKTSDDIRAAQERLVQAILASENGLDDLAIIGVHTRGWPLSQRLVKSLQQQRPDLAIKVGSIDITLYRDDLEHAVQKAEVRGTDIPFDVEGTRVVVVDDVVFTGRTTRAAIEQIMDFGRPRVIELMVLVDRGHRELPLMPNATGFTVNTNRDQTVKVHLEEIDGVDEIILSELAGNGKTE